MIKDFIVFDLETTGLNAKTDKIIEIGAVRVKDLEIFDTFSELVNPKVEISPSITSLTGITNKDLENKQAIDKILPNFLEWLGDRPIFAHNAPFDQSFLEKECYEVFANKEINNTFFDTFPFLRHTLPYLNNYKQITILNSMNIDIKNSHRALDDAYALAELLIKVIKGLDSKNTKVLEKFSEISEAYLMPEGKLYSDLAALSKTQSPDLSLTKITRGLKSVQDENKLQNLIDDSTSNQEYYSEEKITLIETSDKNKVIKNFLKKDDSLLIIDNQFSDLSFHKYICPEKFEFLMKNYAQVLQISEVDGFLDVINWYYNTDSYNIGENNGFLYFNQKKLWDKLGIYDLNDCLACPQKKSCITWDKIYNRLKSNKLCLGLYDYFYNIDIYERKNEDLAFNNILIGEFEKIGDATKNKTGYTITIWEFINFLHNLITYDDKEKKFSGILEYLDNKGYDFKEFQDKVQNSYKDVFYVFKKFAKATRKENSPHVGFNKENRESLKILHKLLQDLLDEFNKSIQFLNDKIELSEKIFINHIYKEGKALHTKVSQYLRLDIQENILWMEKAANQAAYDIRLYSEKLNTENIFEDNFIKTDKIYLLGEKFSTFLSKLYLNKNYGISRVNTILEPSNDNYSVFIMKGLPQVFDNKFDIKIKENLEILINLEKIKKIGVCFSSFKYLKDYYHSIRDIFDKSGLVVLGQHIDGTKNNIAYRFSDIESGVLLGTSDLFEDFKFFDFDAMVIVRLPFINVEDFYFKRKIEDVTNNFGNSFADYILPESMLKFYKIINNIGSEGKNTKVIICDNRLETAKYGEEYLSGLKGRYNYLSDLEKLKFFI